MRNLLERIDAGHPHNQADATMQCEEDLDALHAIVCKQYSKDRERGGRADSPYTHFFLRFSGAMTLARRRGEKVRPEIVVMRKDGTRGVIDLDSLFAEMGYSEPGFFKK
jgi:hypothetical protein